MDAGTAISASNVRSHDGNMSIVRVTNNIQTKSDNERFTRASISILSGRIIENIKPPMSIAATAQAKTIPAYGSCSIPFI